MCNKYQGSANYPTWAIALWIDNEQPSYDYWRSEAADILSICDEYHHDYRTPKQDAVYNLSEALKSHHEEQANNILSQAGTASPYHDILTWALGQVDWTEIAESIINEVKEERDEQEEAE